MSGGIKRKITILGTVHQIQGAEKATWRKVEDPEFAKLLTQLFLHGKDFVFEEASQLGPTKAQHLTKERLGIERYLDVDPHSDDRFAYRIGKTGESFPIDPLTELTDFYYHEFEREHFKRETHWLRRISDTEFTSALFICGYLHALSMARRLEENGFSVETWTYVPYVKLCPRTHATERSSL